jgi:hypothetical protein
MEVQTTARKTDPLSNRWRRRSFIGAAAAAACGLAAPAWAASPIDRRPASRPLSLDYLRRYVDVYPRAAWSHIRPCPERMHPAHDFTRLTIHHAGTCVNLHTDFLEVAQDIEGIMVGHLRRQFGDLGYHFVIDRAGRAWEGRSLCFQGAHVAQKNDANIGVMLLGNFEHQKPASDQVEAMNRLTEALRRRFGIPAHQVYGHRDLGATLCPGANLYGDVVALKQS